MSRVDGIWWFGDFLLVMFWFWIIWILFMFCVELGRFGFVYLGVCFFCLYNLFGVLV